jgi:CelD/BcsL family acetyltransferase involved in cellulose biosynthesis
MRRIRIVQSAVEFEALRPLWEALGRGPSATIFQSYTWNLAAAQHFSDREQPYVVALESDAGAVIVPAAKNVNGTTFLGEMLFDYRDALAEGETSLIAEALSEIGKTATELYLPAIREGALLGSDHGELEPWVGAPLLLRADITPESFLAQHFKARKQMRRLLALGAAFARYRGDSTALLRWVYARKAEQFAGASVDIFSDPLRQRCMVDIAAATAERCDVFSIEVGSAIIAALVTFRDAGVRRFYTIWHDSRWEEYSPGIVLLLHACHESLREGLDVDFLTGEQPHKARFATSRVQLYRFRAAVEPLLADRSALPVAA